MECGNTIFLQVLPSTVLLSTVCVFHVACLMYCFQSRPASCYLYVTSVNAAVATLCVLVWFFFNLPTCLVYCRVAGGSIVVSIPNLVIAILLLHGCFNLPHACRLTLLKHRPSNEFSRAKRTRKAYVGAQRHGMYRLQKIWSLENDYLRSEAALEVGLALGFSWDIRFLMLLL